MKVALDQILAYVVPRKRLAPPWLRRLTCRPAAGAGETGTGAPAPVVRVITVPTDPPVILCSQTPAVLVLFDGEPLFAPIKDTGLKFAVNTNWDMFQEEGSRPATSSTATPGFRPRADGPWAPVDKLPKSLWSLPRRTTRGGAQEPARQDRLRGKMPKVFVSVKPAELILLAGGRR